MSGAWRPGERFLLADPGAELSDYETIGILADEIGRLREENERLLAWIAGACSGGAQRGGSRLVRVSGLPPVLVHRHPDGAIRSVTILGDPEAAA